MADRRPTRQLENHVPSRRVAAPLRQEVVEGIRELVLSGDMEPGDRLIEKALCERFGVSRTVIREALRQLEAERLVVTVANRGPVVAGLDMQEAADLFDVREALEALAGRLFAQRATSAERKSLLKQYRHYQAGTPDDLTRLLLAKDNFYDALLAGAHNEVLRSTIRSLHDRIRLIRRMSLLADDRIGQTQVELAAIIKATVTSPDPAAAWAACGAHVRAAAGPALIRLAHRIGACSD